MANMSLHLVDSQLDPSQLEVRTKDGTGRTVSRGRLEVNEAGAVIFVADASEAAHQLLLQEGGE